jgi:ElaB/YqjD/DUF883 family membrane-anchored ribosome-binding protein
MDQANGSDGAASVTSIDTPPSSRNATTEAALAPGMQQSQRAHSAALGPGAAHRPATLAPYHVHGSVLEGGDSPAVLAQPASASTGGQGSTYRPDPRAAKVIRRTRRALSDAQGALSVRYRRMSDGTDDYVHDNPWKSIALAGVGGLLIGLLISR